MIRLIAQRRIVKMSNENKKQLITKAKWLPF
jgi:HSP20 family protein